MCTPEIAHGRPEAPNCLGRPKLAWLLGFWAFALRFCLCKAQNQVMAGAWLCKPAGPRVCPAEAAYRQPGAPGRLGRPKLAWLLGFWANCTAFLPVQGPKQGCGQSLAPHTSRATCVPRGGYLQAAWGPWPLGPAKTGLAARLLGNCTAFLLCRAQNQVMAKAWPRTPAGPCV